MSVMSMMIFQSCVRYCWVMWLQVSPLQAPRAPAFQDFTAAMDAVNVDLDEMRVSGWRFAGWASGMTWFSGLQPSTSRVFFGGEHVKIGFAFGRLWMAKRCDSAVFDQYRSSVLNCIFHQLLHLWSRASFSGWNLWTNRPFYDMLTYYMFRCICLCILYIYLYIPTCIYTPYYVLSSLWQGYDYVCYITYQPTGQITSKCLDVS